jgi:cytochrome P450
LASRSVYDSQLDFGELETATDATIMISSFAAGEVMMGDKFPRKPSSIELAFLTADVPAAYAKAVAAGAKPVSEPKKMPWGQTAAYVTSIEGTLIALLTPPPPVPKPRKDCHDGLTQAKARSALELLLLPPQSRAAQMPGDAGDPIPKGIKLTPFDATFRDQPYEVLGSLRERAPVLHDEQFNRWYVTRFDDVRHILRDKDMSVDPRKANPTSYVARIAAITGTAQRDSETVSMLFMDDPEHRRLRGLVNKAFTLKAVEALRPRVLEIANALLDKIDGPEFDLMTAFANPLPVTVIAEMLGIDPADGPSFKRWSEVSVATFFNPFRTPEQSAAALAAQAQLNDYFLNMIALRRRSARTDLISNMVHAEEGGDRMTDQEIVSMCNLLLIAGNVTTTDLIGNGVKALLDHPSELAKLKARPDLIGNAVEEILRYDSPVTSSGRNVQREQVMRGCPMHLGDSITVSLAGANHDPEANANPERFDIEREGIQHQSFGGGKHMCLGAPLARVEAQEGLTALFARFPELQASLRGFKYRTIPSFRGLSEYWLRTGQ